MAAPQVTPKIREEGDDDEMENGGEDGGEVDDDGEAEREAVRIINFLMIQRRAVSSILLSCLFPLTHSSPFLPSFLPPTSFPVHLHSQAIAQAQQEAEEDDPDDPMKTVPLSRYNSMLAILRNTLYIYGGIFETDRREFTLDDLYAFLFFVPLLAVVLLG